MAQFRFQIGVPRAGSAAREAESSRTPSRSLRPEAGSAARRAEDERRAAETNMPLPARTATIRVSSGVGRAAGIPPKSSQDRATSAQQNAEISRSSVALPPYPDEVAPTEHVGAEDPGKGLAVLPHSTPLQTAAAKVRSLFRSIFS